jgi:DNA replication protein DnaC
MELKAPCAICKKEMTLEIPDTLPTDLADLLQRKIVPVTAHDWCEDNRRILKVQQEERIKLAARISEWEHICPARFHNTNPDELPDKSASRKVLEWKWSPTGLIAYGKTRSGKTRSTFLLLHREFLSGKTIYAETHESFTYRVTRMVMGDKRVEANWRKIVSSVDILFIDDLGKAKFVSRDGEGKYSEEVLFDVFETRSMNNLPTLFTTEYTGAALRERVSPDRAESFEARLREFCEPIQFVKSKKI